LWAMEQMARLNCHRVPILNTNHRVSGILTQSMIISLIDQNLTKLGDLRFEKVRDITGGLQQEVKIVQEDSTAISAFKTMTSLGISGLGVVSSTGALVDVISVRDLRGIGCKVEHFERLWFSVKRFKKEVRDEFPNQTPFFPITCILEDDIQSVIKKFNDGNLARVFVVNADMKPVHVITQCDILRVLIYRLGMEPPRKINALPLPY